MSDKYELPIETYSDIDAETIMLCETLVIETPKNGKISFRKITSSHWVDKGGGVAECSNCKKEIKTVASVHNCFNFCPFCGAIVQRGLTE